MRTPKLQFYIYLYLLLFKFGFQVIEYIKLVFDRSLRKVLKFQAWGGNYI